MKKSLLLYIQYAAFTAFTITVFLLPRSIHAAEATLSISPPLTEVVSAPGKSFRVTFVVQNPGDPFIVTPRVQAFKPQDAYGTITTENVPEGPVRFEIQNTNIDLEAPFLLPNQQGFEVILNARIPEGTPTGDYYYTFMIETSANKLLEGTTSVQHNVQIASPILISVTQNGVLDVEGSIAQLELSEGVNIPFLPGDILIYDSTATIPVQLILQNTGSNMIKPRGSVSVSGLFLNEDLFTVLPQNILASSSRIIGLSSPEAYYPQTNLGPASTYLKGFLIGGYTVTANVNFGTGTPSEARSVVFYAFPFTYVGILVGGLSLIFIIKRLLKSRK